MNIFKKYGIKEVADVTFYSITKVEDEEFYTPVLYFDTLKISDLTKESEVVTANGGEGNRRIISWNWGRSIGLKLEDALFSEASMSMYWGGRLQAKLSDWTSAIVKCNVANKYGRLYYSTKAYPSPELTESEWEIVFRNANKVNISSNAPFGNRTVYLYEEDSDNKWVAENRYRLQKNYKNRSFDIKDCFGIEILKRGYYLQIIDNEHNRNIIKELLDDQEKNDAYKEVVFPIDCNIVDKEGRKALSVILKIHANSSYGKVLFSKIWIDNENFNDFEKYINWNYENGNVKAYVSLDINILNEIYDRLLNVVKNDKWCPAMPQSIIDSIINEIDELKKIGCIQTDYYKSKYIDRMEKCIVKDRKGFAIDIKKQRENLRKYYENNQEESYTIYYDARTMLPFFGGEKFIIDDSSELNNIYFCNDDIELDETEVELIKNTFGRPNNEVVGQYYSQYLISCLKKTNLLYYLFDNKTLLKLKNKISNNSDIEIEAITSDLVLDQVDRFQNVNSRLIRVEDDGITTRIYLQKPIIKYHMIKKGNDNPNIIRIKKGTIYYKWTRTIDDKDNIDTYIGRDLVIDSNTFPETYKIVGETYIREQKTSKDRRYQFTINCAKVSPSTDLNLQAEGDPVVFSMDIDVLNPKSNIMIQLVEFDVEEDKWEGGTRIVPKNDKRSLTPIMPIYEETVENNNEIY